jgi:DNA polymerase III epsilon subunit-like protein
MYLFFDTETTGLPKYPSSDYRNQPRLVQIAWILADQNKEIISKNSFIIKPDGFRIPTRVIKIHGISTDKATRDGVNIYSVLHHFLSDTNYADVLVAHNVAFD